MKIKVNKDTCIILENEIWNVGDYNVHQVEVELSDDFRGLVNKVRYFVGDSCYDMLITNNVAQIPGEATLEEGVIEIGVYGFDIDSEMLVQSTTPIQKYITKGTYTGEPENVEPLTPTDKQQIEDAIEQNTEDIQTNTNAIAGLQESKQDTLISGENIKTINNQSLLGSGNIDIQSGGGTGNYNDLENKPSINGTTLQGNKTSSQLGLQPAGSYATTADIANFITKDVNDLTYYTKSSDLATVATTGSYTDLTNIPTDILTTNDVVDNVVSTATDDPLSANMGRELNERIQNLASIGKYLAMWDCTTGLPTTDPITMPYTYTTGDYYVISKTGATNYMPNGSSYTGTASTTQYTGTLNVGDFFYYDGTVWTLLVNTGKTVYFANIAGQPTDNTNLATALSEKVDLTSAQTITGSKSFSSTLNVASTINFTSDGTFSKANSTKLVIGSNITSYEAIIPSANNTRNLGSSTRRWKDFYIGGNISDGTNTITVNKIANKDNFVTLTQAEYDDLTPDANTYYFIEEE
jgi:hypothetical protein